MELPYIRLNLLAQLDFNFKPRKVTSVLTLNVSSEMFL